MPTVTITIKDSDDKKGLTCESDMDLRPGMPLSLAQIAAAEIMLRTNREWMVNAGKNIDRIGHHPAPTGTAIKHGSCISCSADERQG